MAHCRYCNAHTVRKHYCSMYCMFWNHVDKGDPKKCWPWKFGTFGKFGYSEISLNGTPIRGHRLSWLVNRGPIPKGMLVLHKCDNRPCANPHHLYLGDYKDNARDKIERGRNNSPSGEENHFSKLTNKQVLEIRRLHASGQKTAQELDKMFGMSPLYCYKILRRQIWSHI